MTLEEVTARIAADPEYRHVVSREDANRFRAAAELSGRLHKDMARKAGIRPNELSLVLTRRHTCRPLVAKFIYGLIDELAIPQADQSAVDGVIESVREAQEARDDSADLVAA
jgi:hypothetical protein